MYKITCVHPTCRPKLARDTRDKWLKLATNSNLFYAMEEDMDINCGHIIDGKKSIEEMGEEIFQEFINIASGKKTKSELLSLGRHEFAPWQIGITG